MPQPFSPGPNMELAIQEEFEPSELSWWQATALWTCLCGVVTMLWAAGEVLRWLWARWTTRGTRSLAPLYASQGTQTFLAHKFRKQGTTGQAYGHTEEEDTVPQCAASPQDGHQVSHPSRHGKESPTSTVGGRPTQRMVDGEASRRNSKNYGGRLMALSRGGRGGLPEGADLIRGLVRKLGDEVNAPETNLRTPRAAENTKASVAKAIKIAKSPCFGRILGSFRKRFHAASARASSARDCKRAEVLRLAREVANDQKVLPLSKSTVEGVAAAWKEAGMKAGTQYLTELKLLHVEVGFEVEAWLKRTLDQCRKGLERDKGPTTRAVEVRVDSWAADKVTAKSRRKGSPANPGLMFLWASIWMLREIEVRNMKIRDVLRNDKDRWTAIWLPTSKGDQQGSGIRRTLSCCGKARCETHCPWRLAAKVMELAGDTLGVSEDYLFKDARDKIVTKRGVISSWKSLFDKGVTGHSPRKSGAMFYVRRGLPIQELAFLGRWKSSVVFTYAEEALQEKPMALPVKLDMQVVDKLVDHVAKVEQDQAPPPPQPHRPEEGLPLEKAFDKPRNLWGVTKGKGWKGRPRHMVTKASWQLPIKEWTTACGWAFAQHSSEFYFLSSLQVDKLKCLKCEAKQKGATLVREDAGAPQ